MTRTRSRKNAAWVWGLLVFIGLIGFTAWAFGAPAYRAGTLLSGFSRFGDLKAAGLEEKALPVVAEGIAGYLKGEKEGPQVQVLRHGQPQDAFAQREIDHMPDVKRLTDWARFIWRIGLVAAALLAADALRAISEMDAAFPRIAGRGILGAGILYWGLVVGLVVWAMVNFTGLFYQLHQWLFPNDFWQLDPGQHLMIQLMPEPFFVDYAMASLKRLAWLLLVFPAAWLLMRFSSIRKAT